MSAHRRGGLALGGRGGEGRGTIPTPFDIFRAESPPQYPTSVRDLLHPYAYCARDRSLLLPSVVEHTIDETSPLHGLSHKKLEVSALRPCSEA